MNNKELKIGQVIYILSDKSGSVVPAIVAEESIVKTLHGNTTSWKLFVGPEEKRKTIDSKQINGSVYSSIDEVRDELYKRLNEFLLSTVQETKDRAKKWYGEFFSEDELLDEDDLISADGMSGENNLVDGSRLPADKKIDTDTLLESVDNAPATPTAASSKLVTSKKQQQQPSPTNGGGRKKQSLKDMIMPSEDELKNNLITDDSGQVHKTGPQMKKIRMPDGTYRDIAVETSPDGGINIL